MYTQMGVNEKVTYFNINDPKPEEFLSECVAQMQRSQLIQDSKNYQNLGLKGEIIMALHHNVCFNFDR